MNQLANRADTETFIALSQSSKSRLKEVFEKISPLFWGLCRRQERGSIVAMTVSNAAAVALYYAILESIFRPRTGYQSEIKL
ncbi:MAG TPA: hypothetical protein VGQ12_17520 [Candidatus Angelobacter sp.]|nr:hypothetical protein [Candidatus Angelobacter sp.]